MSSCKRTSTRTQETVKVEATLSAPVSLSLGTPTVQNSLLYTVHSTARARRQFGIGELNHGRVCVTRAALNWFPDGAWSTRASGRVWRDQHTELVWGRRRWLRVSASDAYTHRLHELNYRQTALVDQLFVTVQPCSTTNTRGFVDSSSRPKAFGSIPLEESIVNQYSNCYVASHLEQLLHFLSLISTCHYKCLLWSCYNIFTISNQL